MKINKEKISDSLTTIYIEGAITEEDRFENIIDNIDADKIIFDFQKLTRINSCGIRNIVLGMNSISIDIEYENCPFFFVEQLLFIPELTGQGKAKINSFDLYYCCLECGAEKILSFKVDDLRGDLNEALPMRIPCKCNDYMELEFETDFIMSHLGLEQTKNWSSGTIKLGVCRTLENLTIIRTASIKPD